MKYNIGDRVRVYDVTWDEEITGIIVQVRHESLIEIIDGINTKKEHNDYEVSYKGIACWYDEDEILGLVDKCNKYSLADPPTELEDNHAYRLNNGIQAIYSENDDILELEGDIIIPGSSYVLTNGELQNRILGNDFTIQADITEKEPIKLTLKDENGDYSIILTLLNGGLAVQTDLPDNIEEKFKEILERAMKNHD